ncbi:hypothetical protein ACFSCZ_09740 [Siminovitchia sediminis]|uniref:Uracil DNA glycosylase superfamily protein n=1 Tax=Siminovitchia sediminis TaxID=1274353 RepID=A0ABW4KG06_9BACI
MKAEVLTLIRNLPEPQFIEKKDLLNEKFLIDKRGNIEMYYAPHNETVNRRAKIVLAGITPGWSQMNMAFREAKRSLLQGASAKDMCLQAKRAARFAGTMRNNVIEMLDDIGVHQVFGMKTSRLLFDECDHLLHTTSIIKYPVFINGKNYTGHVPKVKQSAMLTHYAYEVFPKELSSIQHDYLLVPLGKTVSEAVEDLTVRGSISTPHILFGFPHPSGANGHRIRQFQQEKEKLQGIVQRFADQVERL